MATIDLSQASVLCTPSELRVVKTASEQALAGHSAASMKKHIAQARKLRDKWRDLATRQRREVQKAQGSRGTNSAARSKQKADLFGRVLARLEGQLAKQAELQAAASAPASSSAEKKPTAKKKTPKKKVANEPASKKSPSPTVAQSKPSAGGGGKKKAAKKAVKTETARKQSASPSGAATTGVQRKKSGSSLLGSNLQKSAETAEKRGRLKASGLVTRIRGHVSARGKRAQGRRDSRGGR